MWGVAIVCQKILGVSDGKIIASALSCTNPRPNPHPWGNRADDSPQVSQQGDTEGLPQNPFLLPCHYNWKCQALHKRSPSAGAGKLALYSSTKGAL